MEIIFHSRANKTHFHKKLGFLELGSGLFNSSAALPIAKTREEKRFDNSYLTVPYLMFWTRAMTVNYGD